MAYLRAIDDPDIFCDSTVFSVPSDTSTSSSEYYKVMKPISSQTNQAKGPALRGLKAEGIFPVLPPCTNFSALGNPKQFESYIQAVFPWALAGGEDPEPSTTAAAEDNTTLHAQSTARLRRNEVNSTFLNKLLIKPHLTIVSSLPDWLSQNVFKPNSWPDGSQFDPQKFASGSAKVFKDPEGTEMSSLPDEMSEVKVRTWLNSIAHNLIAAHRNPSPNAPSLPQRCFDSSTSTQGPTGSFALRKPDIVVIDNDAITETTEERIHWRNIYAFIEITSMSDSAGCTHVLTQIIQKAACIFDAQPQRVYVCGLGIYGKPTDTLHYIFATVDHAGVTHTQSAPLSSYSIDHFLHIIYGFVCGSTESLGWDPTMQVDAKTKEVRAIYVTGCEGDATEVTTRKFDVVKIIHSSPILFGRATRVWIVKDDTDAFCILKDSWISSTADSEIQMIKQVEKALKNDPTGFLFQYSCATYYIGQECVHSTDTIRTRLDRTGVAIRIQRRIVTGPIGDPITSFRSKLEFVSVCLDAVNGKHYRCIHNVDI